MSLKPEEKEQMPEKELLEKLRTQSPKLFEEVEEIMKLATECGVTGYQFSASEDAPFVTTYKIL